MNHKIQSKRQLISIRHLEDEDALMTHGFDNSLKLGQEHLIANMVSKIIERCRQLKQSNINIIFSTQKRTEETSKLIRDEILSRNEEFLNVSLSPEIRLNNLHQGKLRIPKGYKDGEDIPTLSNAWEAFWEQSFTAKNLFYRFGDPIIQSNGNRVYPELESLFENTGESWAEFSQRTYDFVVSLKEKDYEHTLNLVVGHTANIYVMHELSEVSIDLSKKKIKSISSGKLPEILASYYKRVYEYLPKKLSYGELIYYEVFDLINPEIQDVICTERDILKSLLK